MDTSLTGKHALVCGASRGIGLAAAQVMAHQGATVTLLARNEKSLELALKSLHHGAGQQHSILSADFTEPDQVAVKVQNRVTELPAQILVNNTGGPPGGPAYSASVEDYRDAFTKHLICNQVITRALLPGMQATAYGRIINVISTSVKQPIPGLGVSNTIRGAVAAWAKTLADELAGDGITVNNVLPGFTSTDRLTEIIEDKAGKSGLTVDQVAEQMRASVPVGRFANPSEVGNAIAFLACPAAAYINGINLPVDGGRTRSL